MIRWIGAALVLLGAGIFGGKRAAQYYRRVRQLRELKSAAEIIRCEINYTLLPLPQLYRSAADRLSGPMAQFFRELSQNLDAGIPRSRAAAKAMEAVPSLLLPNDARMALLELCASLGRYDIDGENRMIQLSSQRVAVALERCESEKKPMARSCAALAISAGIALVILML